MRRARGDSHTAEAVARAVLEELELAGLPWVPAGQLGRARPGGAGVVAVVSCIRGRAVYFECLGSSYHPSRLDRRRRERFQAENAIYLELREPHLVGRTIRVLAAQIAAQTAA